RITILDQWPGHSCPARSEAGVPCPRAWTSGRDTLVPLRARQECLAHRFGPVGGTLLSRSERGRSASPTTYRTSLFHAISSLATIHWWATEANRLSLPFDNYLWRAWRVNSSASTWERAFRRSRRWTTTASR